MMPAIPAESDRPKATRLQVLAPVVRGRKGEHRSSGKNRRCWPVSQAGKRGCLCSTLVADPGSRLYCQKSV